MLIEKGGIMAWMEKTDNLLEVSRDVYSGQLRQSFLLREAAVVSLLAGAPPKKSFPEDDEVTQKLN